MQKNITHHTVLLHEAINGLDIKKNGVYIDATFGVGGHSKLILSKLDHSGTLIAIDRDPEAISIARKIKDARFSIIHGLFSSIKSFIQLNKLYGKINGIIFDLGMCSNQLDNAARGFSFMKDGPLDMRMNQTIGVSAAEWLKYAKKNDISNILKNYGEEKFANRIADAIVQRNKKIPITRTGELAVLIKNIVPTRNCIKKHPATRCFQAIRIFINNEISEIEKALNDTLDILAPKGRLSVISFHSLEDRLIKKFIKNKSDGLNLPYKLPINERQIKLISNTQLKNLGKQKPSKKEILQNSRSRSAILRVAEKI